MDRLTVIEHEMGHILGYDHDAEADSVMHDTLTAGSRVNLPSRRRSVADDLTPRLIGWASSPKAKDPVLADYLTGNW